MLMCKIGNARYSQQVQQLQRVLGYQAHRGLLQVHHYHALPEGQSLPVGGKSACQGGTENCSIFMSQKMQNVFMRLEVYSSVSNWNTIQTALVCGARGGEGELVSRHLVDELLMWGF